MRKGTDLTTGSEVKVILKFAVPMMIGNIFQQLYNVVDAAVVGKFIGKEALSAIGVSFPILFLLSSIATGFAIGGTIIISQFYGAKKFDEIAKTGETLQIVLFGASVFIMIVGLLASRTIFKLLNFPDENLDLAVSYFNILMVGNVAVFGYNALGAILRGLGDSQTPVVFLILSSIVNIIGDIVLVVVFDAGIKGVAWATVFAYLVAYTTAIFYLSRRHKLVNVNFRISFDKEIFYKILKIGLPSSGHMFVVAFGMILSFSIINMFGTDVIAAYTVAGRINSFALMPAMFLSNALTAFVGQNFGARKINRIKKGLLVTFVMASGISAVFTVVLLVASDYLMSLFTQSADVILLGVDYFRIVAPFYVMFGVMFVFNAVYRGTGNTVLPMIFTLVSLWIIRFPAMLWLSTEFSLKTLSFSPIRVKGLWWGEPMAWLSGMVMTVIHYFIKGQKKVV